MVERALQLVRASRNLTFDSLRFMPSFMAEKMLDTLHKSYESQALMCQSHEAPKAHFEPSSPLKHQQEKRHVPKPQDPITTRRL